MRRESWELKTPTYKRHINNNNNDGERMTHEESHQEANVKVPLLRDSIAFFLCGLLNNFGYVVFLSAAEDLGECFSVLVL